MLTKESYSLSSVEAIRWKLKQQTLREARKSNLKKDEFYDSKKLFFREIFNMFCFYDYYRTYNA